MRHPIIEKGGRQRLGTMASALIMMLVLAGVISCDDYSSSEVSIRHFYVTYSIEDDGTNADIEAQFRVQEPSGEIIMLDEGDSISVNGEVMTESEDEYGDYRYQYTSVVSADHYTFEFSKAGKVYTDVVDMPLALDSLTIPSNITMNERFEVDWGNHEENTLIELHFYNGGESVYDFITDDQSTVYNGDNSGWLDGFAAGPVSMIACRTRSYEINRSFHGGEITVSGPWTTETSVTLE